MMWTGRSGTLRWTFKCVIASDSAYWTSDDGKWNGLFYLWSIQHQSLAYAAGWRLAFSKGAGRG